jgi:FAD/FMN-containing dehydrogenase
MQRDQQSANDTPRLELASTVRREFLRGATWLGGALVLGSTGSLLVSCGSKEAAAPAASLGTTPKPEGFSGNAYGKDEEGYEAARQNAIWVGNKPERYPAMIVFPKNTADAVAAVKFAVAQKLKVGVRSGGHSWTASAVQDGSLLIDLFTWNKVDIDAATRTAWVDPGTQAGAFNEALNKVGLAFPTAHSSHVSLGGFLLCGGFGRNSREWGIGCENILEIECINAKGEMLTANAKQNADYYWAARGAGPAFFGIVTRFKVQAHAMPKVIHQRVDVYDMADFDTVMAWTMKITPRLPAYVEPMVFRRKLDEKTGGWAATDTLSVISVAMADSAAKIKKGFALLDTCPAIKRRKNHIYRDDMSLQLLYDRSGASDPWGWRYATDGIWTDADPKTLVPMLRDLYKTPTPRTYIYYAMWGPTKRVLPDMAMTIQARSYIGAYVRWQDPKQDAAMFAWTNQQMIKLAPLAVGSKMNDEAMVRRPARFFSDAAQKRLDAMTAQYDPDGVFLSFLKTGDVIS